MLWNNHSRLINSHAFLGASKWQWLNYDEEKVKQLYLSSQATIRGTELHAFAAKAIKLKIKLPNDPEHPDTLAMYINDAIDFDMDTEVVLYYSDNCFGTTDAICFRNDFLRIHDYKSGTTPAHMEQLKIYAALFCLEYDVRPGDIGIALRIYQGNDILPDYPEADDILPIMDKIQRYDRMIEIMKREA